VINNHGRWFGGFPKINCMLFGVIDRKSELNCALFRRRIGGDDRWKIRLSVFMFCLPCFLVECLCFHLAMCMYLTYSSLSVSAFRCILNIGWERVYSFFTSASENLCVALHIIIGEKQFSLSSTRHTSFRRDR
jgi:hypothetical protein